MKGFALGQTLKQRRKATRKSPIMLPRATFQLKEALSVIIRCLVTVFVSYENGGLRVFSCIVRFLVNKMALTQKSVLNVACSDSHIDKPQRGRPKRAELADVNIKKGRAKH